MFDSNNIEWDFTIDKKSRGSTRIETYIDTCSFFLKILLHLTFLLSLQYPIGQLVAQHTLPSNSSTHIQQNVDGLKSKPPVRERILIHLWWYRSFTDGEVFPEELTQAGIAEVLKSPRAHISAVLSEMESKGQVVSLTGRVKNYRRKVKVYRLSPEKEEEVKKLYEQRMKEEIYIGGDMRNYLLSLEELCTKTHLSPAEALSMLRPDGVFEPEPELLDKLPTRLIPTKYQSINPVNIYSVPPSYSSPWVLQNEVSAPHPFFSAYVPHPQTPCTPSSPQSHSQPMTERSYTTTIPPPVLPFSPQSSQMPDTSQREGADFKPQEEKGQNKEEIISQNKTAKEEDNRAVKKAASDEARKEAKVDAIEEEHKEESKENNSSVDRSELGKKEVVHSETTKDKETANGENKNKESKGKSKIKKKKMSSEIKEKEIKESAGVEKEEVKRKEKEKGKDDKEATDKDKKEENNKKDKGNNEKAPLSKETTLQNTMTSEQGDNIPIHPYPSPEGDINKAPDESEVSFKEKVKKSLSPFPLTFSLLFLIGAWFLVHGVIFHLINDKSHSKYIEMLCFFSVILVGIGFSIFIYGVTRPYITGKKCRRLMLLNGVLIILPVIHLIYIVDYLDKYKSNISLLKLYLPLIEGIALPVIPLIVPERTTYRPVVAAILGGLGLGYVLAALPLKLHPLIALAVILSGALFALAVALLESREKLSYWIPEITSSAMSCAGLTIISSTPSSELLHFSIGTAWAGVFAVLLLASFTRTRDILKTIIPTGILAGFSFLLLFAGISIFIYGEPLISAVLVLIFVLTIAPSILKHENLKEMIATAIFGFFTGGTVYLFIRV
ncbi:MAG: hypothetical protein QW728_01785 [Thermoplasmata archaeon]